MMYTTKYHKFHKNKLRAFERDDYTCQLCGIRVENETYLEFGCTRLPELKYDTTRLDRHPGNCPLIVEGLVKTKVFSYKKRNKTTNYVGIERSCYEYFDEDICKFFTKESKTRPNVNQIMAHHIDGNKNNNNLWNLMTVHKKKCHGVVENKLKENKELKYMFGNGIDVDRIKVLEADITTIKKQMETILSLLNEQSTFDIDTICAGIKNDGILNDDIANELKEKTSYKYDLQKHVLKLILDKIKNQSQWDTFDLKYEFQKICKDTGEAQSHADGYKLYCFKSNMLKKNGIRNILIDTDKINNHLEKLND